MQLPEELSVLRESIHENQEIVNELDAEIKVQFSKKLLLIEQNNNVITKEVQELTNKIEYNFKAKAEYEIKVKKDKELILRLVLQ